ncbi:ABC transporter permease [Deferrisoma camini]|uniref:ABC transporter permease n=1 Tax=Deferrisoma camini TaxID=1035120 RepID=UPI00046D9152|nr:ABC transporter permease [Deferrisoma camini]
MTQPPHVGPWKTLWRRLRRNRQAVAGLAIVLTLAAVAVLHPWIAPYDPAQVDVRHILEPPSVRHWFGTDELGRDVFSRLVYGAPISLLVGFVAVGISVGIGTVLGCTAGYYGGWWDSLVMRFVDLMQSIPTFFLILSAIAFLKPSIWLIMVIIGATGWMGVCRLVRAEVLSLKGREFVLAARVQGAGDLRILFFHLLPNALVPVLVSATLGIAGAILVESSLSFLGLGVQPPQPSWGNMLAQARDNLASGWWVTVFPGMAIFLTVLGYNLLGEGLRDALDPKIND